MNPLGLVVILRLAEFRKPRKMDSLVRDGRRSTSELRAYSMFVISFIECAVQHESRPRSFLRKFPYDTFIGRA